MARIEEDLLGTKEIPDDAYYGIHTARAIENFSLSGTRIRDVPHFVRAMAQVKKASALANGDCHVLPSDVVDAIVWACDAIIEHDRCIDQFPEDVFQGGAGTSVNMNANEVIANLALEHLGYPKGSYHIIHPNDDVNKSQSTNDAYPTGFRLATYALVEELKTVLADLVDAFLDKGHEFADIIKMGRTQLQDAVPMTLGQEFCGWGRNLREDLKTIDNAQNLLLEVNLGGTAIGTGLNTPDGYPEVAAARLAEVTGYPITRAEDLVEATPDNGAYVMVHATLKRLAMKLSKTCNDLRLLASGPRCGLNEINLPQLQAGSSIMPAKVNPVIPEVVNQVCFKVIGNDVTVTMAAEAGQLELNVMEPALAEAMFESITLLRNACDTLRSKCIVGISANPERCRDYVENSIGVVTYFNDVLGHGIGDTIGKESARTGTSVRELIIERGLLDATEVDAILSPDNLMNPTYHGRTFAPGETAIPIRAARG
ncbi:aspartate ammonia-lyase [Nanchangia anserum]|uniref:Aspartate ammonia-lyase n=1 Tax=Nanchangia anserum TaxID=2692125 RepID=A0A8I0GEV9_9ACTO|nr:aspartate ammonia-lyase [Nanchangia anserum]MBD3690213.1 aspartate ammonia-lyase [Nanchangia anserum]QOX82339.1 aspartate ammonia-lyase [Nanchangia anserum]